MHSLHLITIAADTAENACSEVESMIIDFGNENNWRTICGCISEDDEVYIQEEDVFAPEKKMTITDVEKMVKDWVNNFNYNPTEALVKFHLEADVLSSYEWLIIEKYAEHRKNLIDYNNIKDDFWHCNYRDWQLTENGVTNLVDEREGNKCYVVFIDMHS